MGWLTRRSFMTNENVELYIQDRILAKILLPFIPKSVLPNHITGIRFVLIPFNVYYLITEQWSILIPLFIITAFTDMLDGALARVRKQITLWGAILDPTADKLLVASVGGIFLFMEVNKLLALAVIMMEILIVFGAYSRRRHGEYISANGSGKIKMVLQVCAIVCLISAKVFFFSWLTWLGTTLLVISLFFAFLSFVTYGL